MGNSSVSHLPSYNSCFEDDLSRDSITPEYWQTDTISTGYKIASLTTGAIILLFFVLGLPSNIVIIVSIIQQRLYRDPTHILLLNLAIADFLVCLLVYPFTIIGGFSGGYIFGNSDYIRCRVCQSGIILTTLTVSSICILGLISLDRFIFIKYAMKYNKVVTIPRTIVAVIIVWILSIILSTPPLFGFGEVRYTYSVASCGLSFSGRDIYFVMLLVLFCIPSILVIVITNVWIICIVRNQILRIYQTRRTISKDKDRKKENKEMRRKTRKARNKKQVDLIRAFGAILVANIIVWMPIIVQGILYASVDGNTLPIWEIVFVYVTFVMHSILHPIIEGCLIPEIKRTFKKFFRLLFLQSCRTIESSDDSDSPVQTKPFLCCCCRSDCFEICNSAIITEDSDTIPIQRSFFELS